MLNYIEELNNIDDVVSNATTSAAASAAAAAQSAADAAASAGQAAAPLGNNKFIVGDYVVATGTFVPITLPTSGQTLATGYVYRVELDTLGTGTVSGAIYNVRETSTGVWVLFNVANNGTTSNHPQLRLSVSGTQLEVFHAHASTYTIRAATQSKQVVISNASSTIFGLEGAMTNIAGVIGTPNLQIGKAAAGAGNNGQLRYYKDTGALAWTTGVDGSASGVNYILFDIVGNATRQSVAPDGTSSFFVSGTQRFQINSSGTSTTGTLSNSGVVLLNGAPAYTGFGSGLVLNYTGGGTQFGMILKPASSAGVSNAITFLNSSSTAGSATQMCAMEHLGSDAGINLAGVWKIAGNPIASTSAPTFTGTTTISNLTFAGTGGRIVADFSNGTGVNRTLFQTSTTNATTTVGAIPNGTSTTCYFTSYNNSTPTNAGMCNVGISNVSAFVTSDKIGTGTALPLDFNVGSTRAVRIDTAGKVGIGPSVTPVELLHVATTGTVAARVDSTDGGTSKLRLVSLGNFSWDLNADTSWRLVKDSTEMLRIDSSGNLLVGVSSGSYHRILKSVTQDAGNPVCGIGTPSQESGVFYGVSGGTLGNAANAAFKVNKDSTTSRSINASGTINASGADYAEYMTKAEGCGVIEKGQIVGVDANGKLTDKWANAISFLIKSTDPSYVGADVWGSEEAIGMSRPTDVEAEDYEEQIALFEAKLEAARQNVDRIAYCGQVPVNVIGAAPGQYVVPVQDGEGISAELINGSTLTFEQYRHAVGIVQNILEDGRANVRVKTA